jgi:Raf kinase inhibitor-like YbhB/YbcL family protein
LIDFKGEFVMLEKLPESLGHALVNQRAGMESVVYNQLHAHHATARLEVTSLAFAFNARLPVKYTADGEGISPPLSWHDVPPEAESIALLVEDADSPTPHPLVHAIVVGFPPMDGSVEEGALSSPDHQGIGLPTGRNSFFQQAWLPPDPPPGHGVHRYVFQVFALRAGKAFSSTPGRREFIEAILDRTVAVGCVIGTYERQGQTAIGVESNFEAEMDPAL